MADDITTLLRDAAADPKHTPNFDGLAVRGRRQHLTARAGTVLAVALALVGGSIVVWPGLLPSRMPVIGESPTTPTGVEGVELPDGWQRVEVGRAVFGVPGDWEVMHTDDNPGAACTLFFSTPPRAVIGPIPPNVRCPAPNTNNSGPGLHASAITADARNRLPDPTENLLVNGWPATRRTETRSVQTDGQLIEATFDVYLVEGLDLYLKIRTDTSPELARQILATVSVEDTTSPPGISDVPTVAELRAPYEALFEGLPAPQGDGDLVVAGRIDGLGALVEPGMPLPLDQPNAVQDASAEASFVVVVRDADTGDVVAEAIPDTPRGAFFLGPTTGQVGTRYVLEATLNDGGQTTTWTDIALVVEPVVDVELSLTAPARPGEPARYVLVNRGTVNITYGAGYRLEQWAGAGWQELDTPAVVAIGLTLGPASLTDPATTDALPAAGRYRISKTVYFDGQLGSTDHDAQPTPHEISLDFTTEGANATEIAGTNWTTGALRAPGQGERFWSIDLDDGYEVAGDDSAYLDLETLPAVMACFDGTRISESDLRTGERVRVTATGAQTSAPPILVVERLEADCRALPPDEDDLVVEGDSATDDL